MGEYKAGVALIAIAIAYIALFGIVSLMTLIAADYAQPLTVGGFENKRFGEQRTALCEFPRTVINPQSGEKSEVGFGQKNSPSCSLTQGALSETRCNAIAGCNWENSSTFLFFFETDAFCDGTVNLTNYTAYTSQQSQFLKATNSVHDPNTIFIVTAYDVVQYLPFNETEVTNDICALMHDDRRNCELLGCEYNRVNRGLSVAGDGVSSADLIWQNLGGIFTFNVDLGLDGGEADYWISIVFYILTLILLVALWFILPFFH